MNIINQKVTEYIEGFYRPLSPQLAQLRQNAEENMVPVILKDAEGLLLSLIQVKKPKHVLEIGTAVGYSASVFAEACKDSNIVTIEADKEKYEIAIKNIEALGYSHRITAHLGDGAKVINGFSETIPKFDLVFIDASKSHYKEFWEAAVKHCADGCIIVSDNVLMRAMTVSDEYDVKGKHKTNIRKMREYVEYICKLDYCSTSVLPIGDGVAISVLSSSHCSPSL